MNRPEEQQKPVAARRRFSALRRLIPSFNAEDDAGRPVAVGDSRLYEQATKDHPLCYARAASAVIGCSRFRFAAYLPAFTLAPCLVVAGIFLELMPATPRLVSFILRVLLAVALSVPLTLIMYWVFFALARRESGPMTSAALAQGMCPQCLYPLHNLTDAASKVTTDSIADNSSDNTANQSSNQAASEPHHFSAINHNKLINCPECGAAWRSARIRSQTDELKRPPTQRHISPVQAIKEEFTTPLTPRILRDAEGVPVPMWTHAHALESFGALSPERQRVLERPPRVFVPRQPLLAHERQMIVAWCLLALAVPVLTVALDGNPYQSIGGFLLMFLLLGGVFIGIAIVTAHKDRVRAIVNENAVKRILQEHLCPSCGTDLQQAEPDTQGRTACPQCAAVWLVTSTDATKS